MLASPDAPTRFEVEVSVSPELSEDVHAATMTPTNTSTKHPRMKLLLRDAAAPDMPPGSPR
jgi:hypothetical protein